MSFGAGLSPAGQFPAGFHHIVPSEDRSGATSAARFIDPITRDHVAGENGRLEASPKVRQRVVLALTTSLGSSAADPRMGSRLAKLGKIDSSFDRRAKNAVREALYRLTDVEKVVRLSEIRIEVLGGRVAIEVDYLDLTTGLADSVSV